jgi:predicted aspartyl protease
MLARLGLLAAGGTALFLVRDRLPWPALEAEFADGVATPWMPLPRDGLLEVPATVNGRAIRAILDSGAQFSAVDAALAAALELPRTIALPLLAYGVSGAPQLTYTVRLDLGLPGLAVDDARAAALDLARISAATGRDFQLLVGRDVLSRVVLEADFPRRRVRLTAPEAFRPASDALILPLGSRGGAPTVPVSIEGRPPLDLLLDTGASGWIALSDAVAHEAGLLAPGRPITRTHSVGLGGLSIDRLTRASRVDIGPLRLNDVAVQVYAPAIRAPAPSGLVGIRVLRRYRAGLDLGGRRLVLARPGVNVVRGTKPR